MLRPLKRLNARLALLVLSCMLSFNGTGVAAELPQLKLTRPRTYEVMQRTGTAAGAGFADVIVRGDLPNGADGAVWEFRVIAKSKDAGKNTDWALLKERTTKSVFAGIARVAAGGWYRLEIRCLVDGKPVAAGSVEPFGVGEVFIVAGQSNATNHHDELMQVKSPGGRVVAFDSEKNEWKIANDPQPAPDNSDGGSLWPLVGDALVQELHVPVGFANVAYTATSSEEWLPKGNLYPRLEKVGKELGRFRAVLWQQGESDVIAETALEKYVANYETIRATAVKAWGVQQPWLLAKSTHHPTVYNNPEGEGRIRRAIDVLWKRPGFRPGPDTDTLKGDNRGDNNSRQHLTPAGQRRAAALWFAVLRDEIARKSDNQKAGTQKKP